MLNIGYLVPEFPGQTHIFFWRELEALRTRGIHAELVSTRRPPRGIISHSWSQEAMARTTYLAPPRLQDLPNAIRALARARPSQWARCLKAVASADGLDMSGRLRLGALAFMGAKLAQLAHERGFRHVHVHSCADAAHVAMLAHLLSGLSYSLTLHGPLAYYGPNQRNKWRHAAFAIVITKRLLKEVQAQLSGSLPSAVEVAPMGVDTERFRRSRPYTPWTGKGPLRIFSCGRLNPGKGHEDLIVAIGLLHRRGLDARLEIAGEDEAGGTTHRRVLEALCEQLGIRENVNLLGAVSEERVRAAAESAHLFALASPQEPLGVAIMEAMALEMPVVVTGAGGVPELVDHEVDGVLVEPNQSVKLADALEQIARDPQLAQELGQAARKKVQAFDSGRSADTLAQNLLRAAR